MNARSWLILGITAILLASTGCMTCGHHGYDLAQQSGAECEVPSCQRNGVHVFAMSSLNPVSIVALDGLREQLNHQGYSKVTSGQTIHAGWMAREMHRVHEAEPDAVFVIIGLESGAPSAARLAEKVAAEGLPIAGAVVIASGESSTLTLPNIRTIAIGKVAESSTAENGEAVAVANDATFGLATDSRTVHAVCRLLTDAALSVPMPVIEERSAWTYPYAPPMRPEGKPASDPNWVFLFDQGTRAAKPPATPASPSVVGSAAPALRGANR